MKKAIEFSLTVLLKTLSTMFRVIRNAAVQLLMISAGMISMTCGESPELSMPNPGPGPGPAPGPILDITDEQRFAVLNECALFMEALGDLKSDGTQQVLVAWLKARPEFKEAGILGGNVWANFYDGRMAMMVPDWKSSTPAVGGRWPDPESTGGRKAATPDAARTLGIPAGNTVKLFYGLGSAFTDDRPFLQQLFAKSHTDFHVDPKDATIDNLKNVRDVSIFYIDTHGGLGLLTPASDSVEAFGLWTKDKITPENHIKYKHDLDAHNLLYMAALEDNGKPSEWHYAISAGFVDAYMTFTENAIQYIDACESMTEDAENFRDIMQSVTDNGKATYIGWTGPTDDGTGIPTSRFVFDRLLGTQLYLPENPVQRPFDLSSIYDDFTRWNLGISGYGGRWSYRSQNTSEIILTPSIEYIIMNDFQNEMVIRGLFGDHPGDDGKVTVGGATASILLWHNNRVVCKLPDGTSSGDVIVSVGENKSNVVPLTEWNIPLNVSRDDFGATVEVNLNLKIRGDVHKYRSEAGKPPKTERADSIGLFAEHRELGWPVSPESTGNYAVGGERRAACTLSTCDIRDVESVLGRNGNLPFDEFPQSLSYGAYYIWSRDMKKLYIKLIVSIPDVGIELQTYTACPGSPALNGTQSIPLNMGFTIPSDDLTALELTLDNNYNIQTGVVTRTKNIQYGRCSLSGSLVLSARWPPVEPVAPPTNSTEARVVGQL